MSNDLGFFLRSFTRRPPPRGVAFEVVREPDDIGAR
jgi:hypothetical protein